MISTDDAPAVRASSPQLGQPQPPSRVESRSVGFAPDFVPYEHGLALQAEAAARLEGGSQLGTILLLEHLPVYTAGRRSDPDEYPSDGTPVVPVDRGGRVTWHGPGQLVAYPIVRLRPQVGVVDLVRALEVTIIDVMAEFGLSGRRVEGRSGVWADAADGQLAKVAQIGLHAKAGVITHGLAINCSNDPAPFLNFVPCGIRDAGVTTLSEIAGRTITPAQVAEPLQSRLEATIEGLIA